MSTPFAKTLKPMGCTLKGDLGRECRTAADRFVELQRTQAASEQACWDETEQEALKFLAILRAIYGADSQGAADVSNQLAWIAESRVQYATAEQHARRAWEDRSALAIVVTAAKQPPFALMPWPGSGVPCAQLDSTTKPKSGCRGRWIWPNAMES